MQANSEDGFSTLELAFVVLVLGLIGLVAIPRMQSFKARSIQSEAKSGLAAVHSSMQAFYASHGDFPEIPKGTDLSNPKLSEKYGIRLPKDSGAYRFSVHSQPKKPGQKSGWVAAAVSIQPISQKIGTNGHDTLRLNMNLWMCSPYDGFTHQSALLARSIRPSQTRECPQVSLGTDNFVAELTAFDVIEDVKF